MNEREMSDLITRSCPGVVVLEANGDLFFVYDPRGDLPDERRLPFATIVTGDQHDQATNLGRPGVYRVNVGLPKADFRTRFDGTGQPDFTELDQVVPHPVYGAQYWVCVLNPEETLDDVRTLMAQAYGFAVRKHGNRSRGEERADANSSW